MRVKETGKYNFDFTDNILKFFTDKKTVFQDCFTKKEYYVFTLAIFIYECNSSLVQRCQNIFRNLLNYSRLPISIIVHFRFSSTDNFHWSESGVYIKCPYKIELNKSESQCLDSFVGKSVF